MKTLEVTLFQMRFRITTVGSLRPSVCPSVGMSVYHHVGRALGKCKLSLDKRCCHTHYAIPISF